MRMRPRRSEREAARLPRQEPVSRSFGYDRGRPIDRWYIERLLRAHDELMVIVRAVRSNA